MVHSCNPSALERKPGDSVIQGQPWLCCKLEAITGYMKPYFNKREGRGGTEEREGGREAVTYHRAT